MGNGIWRCGAAIIALAAAMPATAQQAPTAKTATGTVEGGLSADGKVRLFAGIPYAKPPVGGLRWQPPQPADRWTGVRKATTFGNRCVQGGGFDDMVFRDPQQSEDCLYLNVWVPAAAAKKPLPVMVWIYGGGFQGGGASEPRQDGEALARKGVIVVNMNYRLGVFGFLSHPELIAESPRHASGNYGLLDQAAALKWVHDNIAAFGGDPANVTIFGESAGSISVSSQMASPLSKGLFKQAIGESGGIAEWETRMKPAPVTGKAGEALAQAAGVSNLAGLRALSTDQIIQATKARKGLQFWPNIDGYFFPEDPMKTYAAGRQAHVALLAGWNADEHRSYQYFQNLEPTKENYLKKLDEDFGADAAEVRKLFPGDTPEQIEKSAHDLASALFITYSTWKWLDFQVQTGGAPVYRYHFDQPIPQEAGKKPRGTHHASDITFVFNTLSARNLPWNADHQAMADIMSSYWSNFAKKGDPNGPGLPVWPRYTPKTGYQVMHLQVGPSVQPKAQPATDRAEYELLDGIAKKRRD
jgi:para-nitrobenzyl esterase